MPHSSLFLYKNLDRPASDWASLTPKAHMEEAFAHPFPGDQRAEPFPEAEEPSREFKHRFTRRFHIQSPNASLTDIHPMPSYAHCRIHSIRSSPIEPFVAPLSTATYSMRSFIAPEQKHPLIGIRQGRLLDKLPPYVPRSMRFIQYTPKQSLLMRAAHYKSRRPLLNARLPTMPRSKSPFRRRAIQYACPEYPLCPMRHPIRRVSPSRQKKPPHKCGTAFYKTMRSFNRAWVQPSQAFDQERARREIYSAASSVAGFSALGAAAFFLG